MHDNEWLAKNLHRSYYGYTELQQKNIVDNKFRNKTLTLVGKVYEITDKHIEIEIQDYAIQEGEDGEYWDSCKVTIKYRYNQFGNILLGFGKRQFVQIVCTIIDVNLNNAGENYGGVNWNLKNVVKLELNQINDGSPPARRTQEEIILIKKRKEERRKEKYKNDSPYQKEYLRPPVYIIVILLLAVLLFFINDWKYGLGALFCFCVFMGFYPKLFR